MPGASRKIRTPDGRELVLSSRDLEHEHLVLAEVLLEMCHERGTPFIAEVDMDEVARRLVAKGYHPATLKPIN
jgi:hypothetical protein